LLKEQQTPVKNASDSDSASGLSADQQKIQALEQKVSYLTGSVIQFDSPNPDKFYPLQKS
jgi:hypothetical protein